MLNSTKEWLKTAPLPVLWLVMLLALGWTYRLQIEQDNTVDAEVNLAARVETLEKQLSRMEGKQDRMTDILLEMRTKEAARRSRSEGSK